MTSFFKPSIALINRLPYMGKFALIGILFSVPTVVTMLLLVGKINTDVDFATKEQHGIQYSQTLYTLFGKANSYLNAKTLAEEADKTAVESAWADVLKTDGTLGTELVTTEKRDALNKKLDAFLADANAKTLADFNTDLVGFISHIGDKSNLILDPQIDSYYIMDSVVLRVAPIAKNLTELLDATRTAQQAGVVSHANLITLMDLKNQIKLNYDALKYGMDAAYKFDEKSGVKEELEGQVADVFLKLDTLLAQYDTQLLNQANSKVNPSMVSSLNHQYEALSKSLEGLYAAQSKVLSRVIQTRSDKNGPMIQMAVWSTVLAFLVIGYIFVGFYLSVNQAFAELIAATEAMAKGDLRQKLNTTTHDEYRKVALGFNQMVQSFKALIESIQGGVVNLEKSSGQLEKASTQMTLNVSNVSEQTSHAHELTDELANNIMVVASAVEQSSVGVKEVAQASDSVTKSIEMAQLATDEMSNSMGHIAQATQDMSGSVSTIASAVEEMSASLSEVANNTTQASSIAERAEQRAQATQHIVSQLESSASEIGQVIEVINGIAAQTNLLALNATIQAASAGEAGKGFAVVANEVKELAKKSANATVDIRQRIEEIQQNTNSAIDAIDEINTIIGQISGINRTIANSVQEQTIATNEISSSIATTAMAAENVSQSIVKSANVAEQLNSQIKMAETNIRMIGQNVQEIATGTTEISRSSSSVANLAQDMAKSVGVVRSNTEEVSDSAGQTKESAEDLRNLATELNRLVGTFKV
jgi:methyl-accepting chemotaxis protein